MVHQDKKVAVGLSGGVDSSVAAALLQQSGYPVVGLTMMIYDGPAVVEEKTKHGCYGPGEAADIAAAEAVCNKLGIPFYPIDLCQEYKSHVLDHFTDAYLAGKTPNPCIVCNQRLKFGLLLQRAKQAGVDFAFFATGHYARVEQSAGRFLLKKAVDLSKDQSYFLYGLSQQQLAHTFFPLGELKKDTVRQIARSLGLQTADRCESQDFIAGGGYASIFDRRRLKAGPIVDENGRVLGKHCGIINYTVGQRRGLGIAAERPLYVLRVDAENNRVVVGGRERLYARGLIAAEVRLIAVDTLDRPQRAKVKIRLNQEAVDATVWPQAPGKVKIHFDTPQMAVCPGQHAVFYTADTVLGGGVIQTALK